MVPSNPRPKIQDPKSRIAFVDMLFSWPPNGGADTDLFHTICGVQELGYEVHLFAAKNLESRERASFEPEDLPFQSTRLDFHPREINRRDMPARFRAAVRAWRPDAVFFGFGYFLKPYVAAALAEFPMAARLYAYELACPRDLRLFSGETPCPGNYLVSPDACRLCALRALGDEIKNWRLLAWSQEYLAARAFMPSYHRRLLEFVHQCRTIIVYNELQREHLQGFHEDIRIIPGGVTLSKLACAPPECKGPEDKKIILMTGRAEDPAKGFDTLIKAGEKLAAIRSDFEIHVTINEPRSEYPWLKAIGWQRQCQLGELYAQADICVVPSIWEEPFGIVAVEAMASGRPVCAARAGGLQEIVEHEKTGFLFERGNHEQLAHYLALLLDNGDLRRQMGEAGRENSRQYDWQNVVQRHYPRLIEDLVS